MILLDTHVVVWLAETPEELSERAVSAIRQQRSIGGLAISAKTLWELAWAIQRGRMSVEGSLHDFLEVVEKMFTVMPITGAIAERAVQLSASYPKDPGDRLIGATALIHRMDLVTRDAAIRASGEVSCVW